MSLLELIILFFCVSNISYTLRTSWILCYLNSNAILFPVIYLIYIEPYVHNYREMLPVICSSHSLIYLLLFLYYF